MISIPPKGNDAKVLGSYFAPLKVEAQSTPNMTVRIAEGAFWTADTEHMEYIGGTSSTITAPASNAKWVLITVTSTGSIKIVDGSPSTNPVLPPASAYATELPLAAVFVGDTTVAITNDMIYDVRPLWQVQQSEGVTQSELDLKADQTDLNNLSVSLSNIEGTTNDTFTLNQGGGLTITQLISGGSSGPAAIRFNPTPAGSPVPGARWEFTNDGATWLGIAGALDAGTYYTKPEVDTLIGTRVSVSAPNMTGDLVMNGNKITDVDSPSLSGDVANKGYVDSGFSVIGHGHTAGDIVGLGDPVESVQGQTPVSGNVTLGLEHLDGVSISAVANEVLQFNGTTWVSQNPSIDHLSDVTLTGEVNGDILVYDSGLFINRPLVTSDISDFGSLDVNYIQTGVNDASPKGAAQDIYGVKTFKDGIVVETNLAVNGEFATSDPVITINNGEAGPGVGGGTGTAGLRIDRGGVAAAVLQYDESLSQWEIGLDGAGARILVEGDAFVSTDITDFGTGVTTELGSNNADALADVTYTTVTTGDHLTYTGAAWENSAFAADITTELGSNNADTLADITYSGLADGDFLRYSGSPANEWVNNAGVLKVDITDFVEADYLHVTGNETKTGDLTIDGAFATSDDVIIVNSGGGAISTAGIEVEVAGSNPRIIWNDGASEWQAGVVGATLKILVAGDAFVVADITDFAVGVTTELGNNNLDTLGNVVTAGSPTLASGDFLQYNGANWVNGVISITDIPDFAVHTHVKANITDFVEADYLHTTGNETKTGDLTIDGALATSDTFPYLNNGEGGAGVGGGGGFAGLLIDRGTLSDDAQIRWNENTTQWEVGTVSSMVAVTTGAHTHVAANITDFTAAADARIAAATADALSDVTYSGLAVNDFLKYNGSAWLNHVLTLGDVTDFAAGDFLHTTGNETKTGDLTIDGAFVTSDAIVLLNDGEAGPGVGGGTGTAGFEIDRGAWDSSFLRWDEASGVWTITEGTGATLSTSTIVSGAHTHFLVDITDVTVSNVEVNYLNGVTGDIQPQIDNHLADMTVHLTSDQNIFLDALNLTGSPLLTAADVNQLFGVTGNVQTQIDGKADLVAVAVVGNFAGLDGAGNLTDSGSTTADFATAVHSHTVSDVTDFATGVTTQLGLNDFDAMQDVAYTGLVSGHLLQYNAGSWGNVDPTTLDYVDKTTNELIAGEKTFSDNTTFSTNVIVGGDLTVNGTTTTINTTNLEVADKNITLNHGYVGIPSGSTGSGLHVNRGFGGSPLSDFAVLVWNDAIQKWEGGIDGSETPFAIESATVAQPHYDLQTAAGSPANASFIVGFDVPAPAAGKAALQVFVNGIKQIEGAGKAYTVTYGVGSPLSVVVTFNSGSEPTAGADVEFYGFGYIG